MICIVQGKTDQNWFNLNQAVGSLIEENPVVSFHPLDGTDQDSINLVLSLIDFAIQYGEDLEPKEREDLEQEEILG